MEKKAVVFVNPASGGQKGTAILKEFQHHLGAENVFDLKSVGPVPGLERCLQLITEDEFTEHDVIEDQGVILNNKVRALVAGGDGTVDWVLSAMEEFHHKVPNGWIIPVAHLPLGTGNDMARSTGWGGGYDGGKPEKIIRLLTQAIPKKLDRWQAKLYRANEAKKNQGNSSGEKTQENLEDNLNTEQPEQRKIFVNYLSIGTDAAVAYIFDSMRENHKSWFKSRAGNKFFYFVAGNQAMFTSNGKAKKYLKLKIDDKPIKLKSSIRSICLMNIVTYMGGTDVWGKKKGETTMLVGRKSQAKSPYDPSSFGDGKIEVVGFTSTVGQGLVRTFGLSGIRLGQGSKICISSSAESAFAQVDGEPWKINFPFQLEITTTSPSGILVKADTK